MNQNENKDTVFEAEIPDQTIKPNTPASPNTDKFKEDISNTYISDVDVDYLKQCYIPADGAFLNTRLINQLYSPLSRDQIEKFASWVADSGYILPSRRNVITYNLNTMSTPDRVADATVESRDPEDYFGESCASAGSSQAKSILGYTPRQHTANQNIGFPVIHKTIDQLLISRLTDSLGKQSPVDGKVFDLRNLITANVLPVIKNGGITHTHKITEAILHVLATAFPNTNKSQQNPWIHFYDILDLQDLSARNELEQESDIWNGNQYNPSGSMSVICDAIADDDAVRDVYTMATGFLHFGNQDEYDDPHHLRIYLGVGNIMANRLPNYIDVTPRSAARFKLNGKADVVSVPYAALPDAFSAYNPANTKLNLIAQDLTDHTGLHKFKINSFTLHKTSKENLSIWEFLPLIMVNLANYTPLSTTTESGDLYAKMVTTLYAIWQKGSYQDIIKMCNSNGQFGFIIPTSSLFNYRYTDSNNEVKSFTVDDWGDAIFVTVNLSLADDTALPAWTGNSQYFSHGKLFNVGDYINAIFRVAYLKYRIYNQEWVEGNDYHNMTMSLDWRDRRQAADSTHSHYAILFSESSSIWARIGMYYGQLQYLHDHSCPINSQAVLRNKLLTVANFIAGLHAEFARRTYGSLAAMRVYIDDILNHSLPRQFCALKYKCNTGDVVDTYIPLFSITSWNADYNPVIDPLDLNYTDSSDYYPFHEYFTEYSWWRYDQFGCPNVAAPKQAIAVYERDQDYSANSKIVFMNVSNSDAYNGQLVARFKPNGNFRHYAIRTNTCTQNTAYRLVIPKIFRNPEFVKTMLLHGFDIVNTEHPQWYAPYGYTYNLIDDGSFAKKLSDALF